MSKLTVYLDLDRTLFHTAQAYEIWVYIEQLHPTVVNATREWGRRSEFYIWDSELYYHDLSAQLRSLGLDSAAIYHDLAASPLADGRFEFPGEPGLMAYLRSVADAVILTYGTDDYQRFKASLCPSLDGVPIVSVIQDKATWLADKPPCILVDDKPLGADLTPQVTLLQASLEGRPTDTSAPWPVFTSLGEVEQYLRQLVF